jgi:hypothetical protein
VRERALAFGWINGGERRQGDAALAILSALNGAPGLLNIGVTPSANDLNCVVAVSDEVRPRFDAKMERHGLSLDRPSVLSRGQLRPAPGSPVVIGFDDRLIFSQEHNGRAHIMTNF